MKHVHFNSIQRMNDDQKLNTTISSMSFYLQLEAGEFQFHPTRVTIIQFPQTTQHTNMRPEIETPFPYHHQLLIPHFLFSQMIQT